MVNKAISERLEESRIEVIKRKKENDDRQAQGLPSNSKRVVKILNPRADTTFFVSMLDAYEEGTNVSLHKTTKIGREGKTEYGFAMCRKSYAAVDPAYDSCDVCDARDPDGKKPWWTKAIEGRLMRVYVHNFEGATFNEHPVNPKRILFLRHGEGMQNLKTLKDDNRKGLLTKGMFEFTRTGTLKDTRYPPLKFVHYSVAKEIIGEALTSFEIPLSVREAECNKSSNDIVLEQFSSLDGVILSLWGLEEETKTPEPVAQPTKGSAKKALG